MTIATASSASASVLYSFHSPELSYFPIGPISFEYIAPHILTEAEAIAPPNFGNIPVGDLASSSADFPITSVYLSPGEVQSPFETVVPQILISFNNPNFSSLNFDFGVPHFFDHYGTYSITSGLTAGATLTIEAIPEPEPAPLIALLLFLGVAGYTLRHRPRRA